MNKAELQDKIKRLKANKFVPEHLKAAQVKKLEAELASMGEEKPEPKEKGKPSPEKKEKVRKKVITANEKRKVAGTDKTVHEISCDELLAQYKKRKEQQKKAGKRHKTTSVIEKVTHNVLTGVKQAINNIPAEKMKENPGAEISKIKKLEKLTLDYLHGFKAIMGEDYDAQEIADELKEIREIAKKLEEKYAKK